MNDRSGYDVCEASFSVDGRTILGPISLTLAKKQIYALVGQNGSGKSTLLKLLARQQPASEGTIAFDGVSLKEWKTRPFACRVAYLPQQPGTGGALTVRELVEVGRYPWHGPLGRMGAADRAAVEEAIELADVATLRDRLVETLSGGERQRAWIAMMLAQQSEVLLLDEPTDSLDLLHEVELMRLIRRLVDARNLGVVLVLHDVNVAARYCDEIIALRAGTLLTRGTPQELMQPEALESIYDVPMGILTHPQSGTPIAYVR
ncbi:MAG TPA: ATP-binding cassette domain-containing protein [Candidatus Cybelea sp.]|jgi:iron complex transport system ATP-binding protein|nr:ATP-binding cassette domain-containing protein [Candidatus Cybelea sp.]